MSINGFFSLYREDRRCGDQLLAPQRFCLNEWKNLSLPLNDCQYLCVQLAKKVVACVLLLLPTLVSLLVGIVGVAIKACSSLPPQSSPVQPLTQDRLQQARQKARREDLEEIFGEPIAFKPMEIEAREAASPFQSVNLGQNIETYIDTFLTPREVLVMARVSKAQNAAAMDRAVWDPVLGKKRIWGPSRVWDKLFRPSDVRRDPTPLAHPLLQLKANHEVQFSGPGALCSGFLNDLLRHHKGGPVAFLNLPKYMAPSEASLSQIRPGDMAHSVMRSDNLGFQVLLIRLIDPEVGGEPVVLIFKEDSHHADLQQLPNAYWGEGQLLKVGMNRHHGRYILNIINGMPFDEEQRDADPRLKRQVRLA